MRSLVFGILRDYGLSPDSHTDADLDDFEAHYFKRGGEFFVLTTPAAVVIGCVGLYRVDATTLELRKMYLAAAWRGRGFGRLLLDHALARAGALGAQRITLETAAVLQEAIALYRRAGFQPLADGVHSCRCDLAMELKLSRVGP
mgnify:CR=1 FL=1